MDRIGQSQLGLDPEEELGRRKFLRRLGRAVVEHPRHDDGGGVDVQAQLDGLMFLACGLLRANFGVMQVWFSH
jgi:hypothetical protein